MTERTPKFLLVRLGSLGDVIHAIPSAAALRARYPDAQIDWLVDPRYTSVLQLVDGLNDAIPVDPRKSVVALLAHDRQTATVRSTTRLSICRGC